MAVAFGFSVGDFVAVADLVYKVIAALSETRGAATEYASLIELLKSISTSLSTIMTFVTSSPSCSFLKVDQALMNGLWFHVDCCRRLISKFLLDSRKYTESLFNGQGNKAKSAFRKIKWCLFESEDALKLEQRLGSHLEAFQQYLTAINIQTQAQAASKFNDKLDGMFRTFGEVYNFIQISQKNTPKALGYPWEGQDPTSHISFEDALGRKLVLPQVLCRSFQSFEDTLHIMFKNHPGYDKIIQGEYEIVNDASGKVLFSQDTWREEPESQVYWPSDRLQSTKLAMNILYKKKLESQEQALIATVPKELPCSGCGYRTFGSGFRKCQNCDLRFKWTVSEKAGPNPRYLEDDRWPERCFSRGSLQFDFLASLTGDVANQPPQASPNPGNLDTTLAMTGSNEKKYFRRIHEIAEHFVPQRSGADYFQASRIPLIQAAGQGDARWVQEILLLSDTRPDVRSFQGWTALQEACSAKQGRVEAVAELLLKHGADVNAPPGEGYARTALQAACEGGQKPLIELLLKHGADIHAPPAPLGGRTALQAACAGGHLEIAALLLQLGADPNEAPSRDLGRTALQSASQSNEIAIVELLVKYGASVNDFPSQNGGFNALQAAVLWDNEDIVKRLIDLGADVNAPPAPIRGYTAISCAESISMSKYLISQGADINGPISEDRGKTALQFAIGLWAPADIEELILLGADVNAPAAPTRGRNALQEAAYRSNIENVELLVDKYGADVNAPRAIASGGYTALEAATFSAAKYNESLDLVKFLIERGGQLTPIMLHFAASHGRRELAELLLNHGADPNKPPNIVIIADQWGDDRDMGQTVLETAKLNNRDNFVEYLQRWQA